MLMIPDKPAKAKKPRKPRAEFAPRRATERKLLTDKFVTSLKAAPKGDRTVIYDTIVTSLGISVTDNGTKTWILNTRYPTPDGLRPAKSALGKVGQLTLVAARKKAKDWHELIKIGKDPRLEVKRLMEAEQVRRANTFGAVAEDFIAEHLKGKRKAKPTEMEIRHELLTHWQNTPIADITDEDVKRLVKRIKNRGAFYVAHTVFGTARSIFNFAIEQPGYGLKHSPCDRIKPAKLIGAKKPRQRVLEDDEIAAYWRAACAQGEPWASFYKLLMLTGQRKSDVSGIRRNEINWPDEDTPWVDALWTIPAARFKSDHVHLVPLTEDAQGILLAQPHYEGDCVLTTTLGKIPINGFSKSKYALDQAMAVELGREPLPWVQHDIRRTVRTQLSKIGVRFEVAELVIGHQLTGLHAVYDRYTFIRERREALEAWQQRLRQIIKEHE